MRKYIFFIIIMLFIENSFATEPTKMGDIIFQGFGWEEYNQPKVTSFTSYYKYIQSKIDELKMAGFTVIWMPSILNSSDCISDLDNVSKGGVCNSVWGNSSDLLTLVTSLKKAGIHPIADIDINRNLDITTMVDITYNLVPQSVGTINQTESQVVLSINNLLSMGFEGWHLNTIKGKFGSQLKKYLNMTPYYFSFGDNWDTNESGVFKYSVEDSISTATLDYSLYYAMMQEGFDKTDWKLLGSGESMGGLLEFEKSSEKVVTFVDNIHTFNQRKNNQIKDNMDEIIMGYAYILTHPGVPCVFLPHYYGGNYSKDEINIDYGSGIKSTIDRMLAIRRINGVSPYSKIKVVNNSDYYSDYVYDTVGEPVVALCLGNNSAYWKPIGNGWQIAASGYCYKIWAKKLPKLNKQSNCEITNDDNSVFNIYPNPTSGSIKFSTKDIISVVVTNTLGKVFYSNNTFNNDEIDISTYPQGIYVIKVINIKGRSDTKLVYKI